MCAAPKGNRFWEVRATHGRDKIFSTPEILWESCCEYFEWVEANPLKEAKPFSYQGETKITEVDKMRAMTIDALCCFLDINVVTWREYRKRNDFTTAVTRVEQCIREQKFSGAAADLLNSNIIAYDLGFKRANEQREEADVESDGFDEQIKKATEGAFND